MAVDLAAGLLMAVPAIFLARAESRSAAAAIRARQADAPSQGAGSDLTERAADPAVADTAANG